MHLPHKGGSWLLTPAHHRAPVRERNEYINKAFLPVVASSLLDELHYRRPPHNIAYLPVQLTYLALRYHDEMTAHLLPVGGNSSRCSYIRNLKVNI